MTAAPVPPAVSAAARALGRLGRGRPKRLSATERARRADQCRGMAAARSRRREADRALAEAYAQAYARRKGGAS